MICCLCECELQALRVSSLLTRHCTSTYQSSQETKIVSLERIIRDLEDEVTAVRHDEALASAERKEESKQLEAYKSHSNYMKSKVGVDTCLD